MNTRQFNIRICNACYNLEPGQCHEPECVFIREHAFEVSKHLDMLNIRPIVDGEQQDLYPLDEDQDK